MKKFLRFLISICIFNIFFAVQTVVKAVDNTLIGPGREYQYLRDNPLINNIETDESTVEVDGKYNFSLQLINNSTSSSNASRDNTGTMYKATGHLRTDDYEKGMASKVFVFEKKDASVEQSVYVRQAGFYMGKSIDIKITLDTSGMNIQSLFRIIAPDYSERTLDAPGVRTEDAAGTSITTDNLGNAFLYLGSTTDGVTNNHHYSKNNIRSGAFYFDNRNPKNSDKINYKYDFFETVPLDGNNNIVQGNPISITGLWNIDNSNMAKFLTDLNDFNDLTKYYIYNKNGDTDINGKKGIKSNSNNVVYKLDANNNLVFTGNKLAYGSSKVYGKISTSFTTLFENKTSLSYSVTPTSEGSNSEGAPSGRRPMGIKYSRTAIPRVAPTDPYIIGLKNTAKHNEEYYTDLQYDIRFGVGSNDLEKRNDALSVQTEVPEYYDIVANKVEVVNMVTDKTLEVGKHYTVEIDPANKSKVKIIFTDPTSTDINDGYFRISINAETNSKFEFAPDKYGYLNDPTSEDNGYMHFDLADNTTLTYTHNASNNINKTLTSKKIDERSIAKVNYEGIPLGEAKDGLTLLQGNSISDEYPDVTSLLQDGFDTLVDTNNISRDTPVEATFIGDVPETKNLAAGTVVDVPIRLTTPLGVTKDIVAKLTIRSTKSLLNVEFRNEADELLSSIQQEYPINTEVDLTEIPEVVNELDKYIANGEYSIVEKPTEEKFILTNTNGTKVYKLKGNLIIASAPELFDFGSHEKKLNNIEQKQAINLDTQNPLTIKDRRADKSNGWTLQLKSITEFNSGGEELTGAMIYRLNATDTFTVSSSAEKAYEKADGGDYNLTNDWSENGAGLGINIDIKKIKKLGTYQAELEWELIAGTGP